MNQLLYMLAQSSPSGSNTGAEKDIPATFLGKFPLDDIWQFIANIGWMEAVVFMAFGAIYLAYGWRIFKALVVINFAGIGLCAGIYLGTKLGSGLWGGIIGAIALGAVCYPFKKYAVSLLGAMAGGVLGAALWRIMTLPDPLIWAGALAGLVAGGLLAFSSFKMSIMLFTSLQGATFVVVGMLALLNDYPKLGQHLTDAVYAHVFLLPALLVVPTVSGIYLQAKLLKLEANWAMPE
jgi:hypothetical protein